MVSDGVDAELKENVAPRMYYRDQLQRQNGQASEICPFVLHIPGSYYDIGFMHDLENPGELVPVFDDYDYAPSGYSGGPRLKGIKSILGATWQGPVEHWAGQREATEATMHSIGQFLRAYTVAVFEEQAVANGHTVESVEFTEDGIAHLTIDDGQY